MSNVDVVEEMINMIAQGLTNWGKAIQTGDDMLQANNWEALRKGYERTSWFLLCDHRGAGSCGPLADITHATPLSREEPGASSDRTGMGGPETHINAKRSRKRVEVREIRGYSWSSGSLSMMLSFLTRPRAGLFQSPSVS
jgi:hypothetical protein